MAESKLYPKINKWILESYPKAWIYRTTDRFRVGIPDFILSVNGMFIGIEVKDINTKLRGIQKQELIEINESGGFGFLLRDDTITQIGSDKTYLWQDTSLRDIIREFYHEE